MQVLAQGLLDPLRGMNLSFLKTFPAHGISLHVTSKTLYGKIGRLSEQVCSFKKEGIVCRDVPRQTWGTIEDYRDILWDVPL